ncbi:PKc-like superfamily domain-containing protein [Histoplasma capsulatum]|uniref:PKc-like superfamily domain-containing protein n=1 Tax=Ajellomyces capsulatus TaxID=5037 RepID=A0A8A1MIX2_AJECA|nr:PKc-like superfamily domain-containing protein [Histoplasma capsulatum]
MAEQQPLYSTTSIDLFTANFESSPLLLAEYLQHVQRLDPEYIPNITEEDEVVKNTPSRTACLRKNSTTVQAVEESLVPVYLTNSKAKEHHLIGARLPSSIHMDYSMFPIYHPSTIQIPIDSRLLPAVPQKVFIHGTPNPSFFKIVYRGDVGITLKEPLTYSKIHTAKFDATVRTSRLEGLVEDDNGRCIDGRDPRLSELRKKWLDQITVTLKHLHSQGIIWGDAKAANVLIDVNEDAYLNDFGGGYTQGWVGWENANSIDGDLQVVSF